MPKSLGQVLVFDCKSVMVKKKKKKKKIHVNACVTVKHLAGFFQCNGGKLEESEGSESELLLVSRQNDNHTPGPCPGRLVPNSHQRSEFSNSIPGTFSKGDNRCTIAFSSFLVCYNRNRSALVLELFSNNSLFVGQLVVSR